MFEKSISECLFFTVPRFRITGGVLGLSAPKISDGLALNINDCAEMSVAGGGQPE
jgi:hypothetical protein